LQYVKYFTKNSQQHGIANQFMAKVSPVRSLPLLFMIIVFRFINLLRALFGMRSTQNWTPPCEESARADN